MVFRRIVAVILLLAVAGLVLPAPAYAGDFGYEPGSLTRDAGFLARILASLQATLSQLVPSFSAFEGATITPSG